MDKLVKLLLFVAVSFLSGCLNLYQYQAQGRVTLSNGENRNAVIFWHKDEGRHWYLKKYEQLETTVKLRICNELPKQMPLAESGYVEWVSKANDILIAGISDRGEIENLEQEKHLRAGERCAVIQVDDKLVSTNGLAENVFPELLVLCRNDTRPERFPQIDKYPFEAVSRQKIDKEKREAPDPCR